jgi:alkylation response protein AidB-like acyl-CoA dehydrogenase
MGDGSAAWNVMIGATTGLLSASLPEQGAREIYASDAQVLSVGVTAPAGRADRIEGGYRVTGRWPFGSGCQNAQWISGGCFVYEHGESAMDTKNHAEVRFMIFSADQVNIENTWDVVGLRGTGSHHFSVKDVFVPDRRNVLIGGRANISEPLYQFPMLGLLALGVASVALGIGFRALDEFSQLAVTKQSTGASRKLAERGAVQASVARSLADLRSAEAFMKEAVNNAWDYAEQGDQLDAALKSALRLAAANGTHSAVAAVDRLYDAAGGSAIYMDSPLQQCFRDVHVVTQHIMVANPIYEVVGRVHLGLPARSML